MIKNILNNSKGLSLIEALISIGIIGISVLTLAQSSLLVSKINTSQTRMEEINQTNQFLGELLADVGLCTLNFKSLLPTAIDGSLILGPNKITGITAAGSAGAPIIETSVTYIAPGIKISRFEIKLKAIVSAAISPNPSLYLAELISTFESDTELLGGKIFIRRTNLALQLDNTVGNANLLGCSTNPSAFSNTSGAGAGGTNGVYSQGSIYGYCTEYYSTGSSTGSPIIPPAKDGHDRCLCESGFTPITLGAQDVTPGPQLLQPGHDFIYFKACIKK